MPDRRPHTPSGALAQGGERFSGARGTARQAPTGARVVTDPKGLFRPETDHPPASEASGGTPRRSAGGG
ncbi:hypothetical protein SBRY_10745 [Actinacidiphila bryophytorum]|uniref:Uncharacterized protein n=1 Tax=Actinacidiphila bryophytorum TaxID=1436133 RepID=A0A9W4ECC1_9ACTN|nr:hypothetical protein SBRY_10745 [Actinacidiphila bryophytorum]